MDLGLKGKRALVTAASRGLGRAAAVSLAREGAVVAVAGRASEVRDSVVAQIAQAGGQAVAVDLDFSNPGTIAGGVEEAARMLGGLDIVVANTPGPASGPFMGITAAAWRDAFEMTVHALADLSRVVIPHLQAAGGGRLIFVTTVGVKMVQPDMVLSDATRLAVTGLAKSLSVEHAGDNILVNSLCPGPIATDRYLQLIDATQKRQGLDRDGAEAIWLDEVPLRRAGSPEQFGDLVAVLASDAASYVTGAALAVDGGKSRAY
ncbi:SDR family oxidoreductase [Defluviimonas sp. SAOS-178_SWC]|uniref:SDR family oxidoreductase n=1 Tax=Defluviimonas sp. SAOS-178_SWC TaxID=3121287 RepID=UPI003221DC38